jgi:3-hydroxyacyl-[acyl-carrier-protein] dehydratase
MTMTFEEIRNCLKQRFPFLMVDRVLELEPGKRIKALKNVTGNEIQFLGHFPDYAIMPGVFIVEALGQAAAVLLSQTTDPGRGEKDILVLGAISEMRFFAPVVPGQTMLLEVAILKAAGDAALVEGNVTVNEVVVAKGKLSFARRTL